MSVHSGRQKMMDSTKKLHRHWQQTLEDWRDARARQFGKAYLEPLESDTRTALSAMGQLQEVLERAKRECRED